MQKNNIAVFEAFAKKAAQRLEERKKKRTLRLRIASMDNMEIEIHGISDTELMESTETFENGVEQDRYTIYMASPTLQESAKLLVEQGVLAPGQEYRIAEAFSGVERAFLIGKVLELSGLSGDPGIEVIKEGEEIKNS